MAERKAEAYLVEFVDGTNPFFTKNSVCFKDMIIQLANYTGANCPLFIKALRELTEINDMVAIYEVFSSYSVDRVLKVEAIPYERRADNA